MSISKERRYQQHDEDDSKNTRLLCDLCRKLVEFRRNVLVMRFLDSLFKRQNQRRQDRDTTEHTKNNALCHNDTQIPAKRKCHETHSQETCNRCDRTSCNRCEGIGNRLCHGSILILRRILPLLLVTVPEEDGIVHGYPQLKHRTQRLRNVGNLPQEKVGSQVV